MKTVIFGALAALTLASSAMAADYHHGKLVRHTDDGKAYILVCDIDVGPLGCWKHKKQYVSKYDR